MSILWWNGPKGHNTKSRPSSPFSEKETWAPGGCWWLTHVVADRARDESEGEPESGGHPGGGSGRRRQEELNQKGLQA